MMAEQSFIYTYIRHSDEFDLCRLEMRSFFGYDVPLNVLKSTVKIPPSRSPFMKERLDVLYESDDWDDLCQQVEQFNLMGQTFKVTCLNTMDLNKTKKIGFDKRREKELEIAYRVDGQPDLLAPERVLGFLTVNDKWYFGDFLENEPIWFHHQNKPHSYSTALSTRVARAIANIAVPDPTGLKVIDPCCGIGNVLVEALSMGMDIVGRDINRLVIQPARDNIAHFGFVGDVHKGPIAEIEAHYDVAIIDMPYNIFTDATPEQQFDIVKQARRIADRVIIVTIDTIDHMIEEVGLTIVDRGEAKKGLFIRQVVVCE